MNIRQNSFESIDKDFASQYIGKEINTRHPVTNEMVTAKIVDVEWNATIWNVIEQDDGAYLALYELPDGYKSWGYLP